MELVYDIFISRQKKQVIVFTLNDGFSLSTNSTNKYSKILLKWFRGFHISSKFESSNLKSKEFVKTEITQSKLDPEFEIHK